MKDFSALIDQDHQLDDLKHWQFTFGRNLKESSIEQNDPELIKAVTFVSYE